MIAIIELYQHHEVLRHYCDLLKGSDHKVKIFCSSIVHQMLEDLHNQPSFEWVVQTEKQNIPDFLSSNYPVIKEAKLVFITTVLNNFKAFYQLSKINKTILLVHNAHSFLAPQNFLSLNLDTWDRLRWLKIQLIRAHYYKRQLLENLAGLVFPNQVVLRYVQNRFTIPSHLKLVTLSFASYQPPSNIPLKDYFIITIPCTVTSVLRDYDLVLSSIRKIKNKLSKNIQLILLGKPKGDGSKIITQFKALDSPTIKITTFKKTIPLEEYNYWLSVSNFLILPLHPYCKNYIYQEQLGYSKISGGVNDMIRFGVPALIPDHYPLEEDLEKMVERYPQNLLAKKLLHWINQGEYLNYQHQVKTALKNHYQPKMRSSFFKTIEIFL